MHIPPRQDQLSDICVQLADTPGSLATLGEALGCAGIPLHGGGIFTSGGSGLAHFLVVDGEGARQAAAAAGIDVLAVQPVLVRQLKQGQPGQLGAIARALANAGVNILVQYSDHANRLILIVDKPSEGAIATAAWAEARQAEQRA